MNELMTADEAAREKRISGATVRRWCREGKITGAERVGRQWRFTRAAFDAALAQMRANPKDNGLAFSH